MFHVRTGPYLNHHISQWVLYKMEFYINFKSSSSFQLQVPAPYFCLFTVFLPFHLPSPSSSSFQQVAFIIKTQNKESMHMKTKKHLYLCVFICLHPCAHKGKMRVLSVLLYPCLLLPCRQIVLLNLEFPVFPQHLPPSTADTDSCSHTGFHMAA